MKKEQWDCLPPEQQMEHMLQRSKKQETIGRKYRLPSFNCPNPACNAKNILFAGDAVAKNETILKLLEENDIADYVIICPKCKKYIAVRRHVGIQRLPIFYRSQGYTMADFGEVFNHRILGWFDAQDSPNGLPQFWGTEDESGSTKQETGNAYRIAVPRRKLNSRVK